MNEYEYIPHWWELPPDVRERVLERMGEIEVPPPPPRAQMLDELKDLRLYNCIREHRGNLKAARAYARRNKWPVLSVKEWKRAIERTAKKIEALCQDESFLARSAALNRFVAEELARSSGRN